MSKRILLAGLFHETHTFLEGTTGLEEFGVRRGAELLAAQGDGSPLAGTLEVAADAGWQVVPTIDLRATPGPTVADAVIELFWSEFEAAARRELPRGIDGVQLILHGAMVSESLPDVEGEIVARLRSLPGLADVPVCGVLDLHGNISRPTIERTQGMIAYRQNPHTDSHAAAVDAARLMDRILASGERPAGVWEQPPVMWPPTGTGTADDPMRTLEAMARDLERRHSELAAVNVFGGFSFADTPETGVSFSAFTFGDPEEARRQLRTLSEWAVAHREQGNVVDVPLEQVIPRVREHVARGETPVVIVEPADNIGGGAPGDGTSILRALVRHRIGNSAVVINDPQAVERLRDLPIGSRVRLLIGGRGSRLAEGPLELDLELLSTSDGRFDLEDRHSHLASMSGIHIDMGPCAVVRHVFEETSPPAAAGGLEGLEGVQILLTSRKTPPFDLGQFRSQGIEPERLSVIGIKAAVAHRRAYEKVQAASYTVATPGPCSSDLRTFPFRRVRRPVFPLDGV